MFHVFEKTESGWDWLKSFVTKDDAIYHAEHFAFAVQIDCLVRSEGQTVYYVVGIPGDPDEAQRLATRSSPSPDLVFENWSKEGF